MTEETTTQRDVAQDAMAISAETMGHDFLAGLLAELRSMPDHWSRLSEDRQQQIIENLKGKIEGAVDRALTILSRNEFAAVQADLKAISWQQGITATLSIPRDALFRHQLCDAQGQKVLVVLTNADRWLGRMDEIKAKADQQDLFESDAVTLSGVDQPHYRRDEDRIAPAGPTWEDLKKSLSSKGEAADADAMGGDSPETPDGSALLFGSAASESEERTAELRILQEQLGSIGVGVSLGALQAFSPEQITATRDWARAYAEAPDSCKIARPLWLPIPEKGAE